MSVLPLQDMIAGAIKTASAKIASEAHKEPEKVKKLLAYEKKEHGHIPSPHEEEVECESKEKMAYAALISDDHVEKLASAVDFLATHLGDIAAPGPIAQALAKTAMKPGAGGGTAGGKSVPNPASAAGALETTQAIGGSQKYTKNKAKGEQAEDEHNKGLERNEGNPHGAKTHLETNYHEAPGNNHGSVPHHEYPAKGPLVAGPSGAHNKGTNAASLKTASFAGKATEFVAHHAAQHPRATAAAGGALLGAIPGAVGGAAAGGEGHRASGALKGGLAGAAMGGAMGGGAMHKHLGNMAKAASAQEIARQHILMKLAGEDVMKANIDGGGTTSPLAGKGQLKTMKAGEESPTQGGTAANSQDGNSGTKLVDSNKAAIDYTKRDAKKLVVNPLKEVLDQPAFSEKHDNKLQENLRNTGKAGVKIAGAAVQSQLQKIASGGCTCNSKGECQFCTMKAKLANMGGMGGTGGGMNPMAGAGEGHDGCTCGHTGECRVCKLGAAISDAKGKHPGEVKEGNAGCY